MRVCLRCSIEEHSPNFRFFLLQFLLCSTNTMRCPRACPICTHYKLHHHSQHIAPNTQHQVQKIVHNAQCYRILNTQTRHTLKTLKMRIFFLVVKYLLFFLNLSTSLIYGTLILAQYCKLFNFPTINFYFFIQLV